MLQMFAANNALRGIPKWKLEEAVSAFTVADKLGALRCRPTRVARMRQSDQEASDAIHRITPRTVWLRILDEIPTRHHIRKELAPTPSSATLDVYNEAPSRINYDVGFTALPGDMERDESPSSTGYQEFHALH